MTDFDSANLTGATVTLTNAQAAGDRLLVNGSSLASGTLPSGIAWTRTDSTVTFPAPIRRRNMPTRSSRSSSRTRPTAPPPFSGSVNVTATDGAGTSNVAVAAITVNAVNDAPVLADTALSLTVLKTPASFRRVGSLVSVYTGGITEPDGGATRGIAIVASNETNGTWYYSVNGGTNWTAVGVVNAANSLLLADNANTRLYFAPNANYNGSSTSALTVRAWDQTSGAAGTKVSTATTGGTTAFSSATDVIDVSVTAVNDAPTLTATGSNPTFTEDGSSVSLFSGAAASTIEGGQTITSLTLTVSNISNGAAERLTRRRHDLQPDQRRDRHHRDQRHDLLGQRCRLGPPP